jgi:RNA 2',3'-cyclic 3'-phosphodiesterase
MAAERLFFALWPPASVVSALVAERDRWPGPAGRPTHPEDLHATVVFLGALEADQRACAENAAGRVSVPPFSLTLDRVGYWRGPRIRWVGQDPVPAPLLTLVRQLDHALTGCDHQPERRPYRLHLTLARKAAPLRAAVLSTPVHWPVKELVLAASHAEQRPAYRVLRRWPLSGAAGAATGGRQSTGTDAVDRGPV